MGYKTTSNRFLDYPSSSNKIGDGPEGPEVLSTTNYLRKNYSNKLLIGIDCQQPEKYFHGGQEQFKRLSSLMPFQLKDVFCKGKRIYFHLNRLSLTGEVLNEYKEIYIYSHLKMSGRWSDPNQDKKSCTHVRLTLNFGEQITKTPPYLLLKNKSLIYDDVRGFGKLQIFWQKEQLDRDMNSIGPDLLSEDVPYKLWSSITNRHQKMSLMTLLMEQKVFSGIGNYLKAEILYAARLDPNRKVSSLNEEENKRLWSSAISKIRESYNSGGLTIKDYHDPMGNDGKFQIKIYEKEYDPYGNPVHKIVKQRTTYWVPAIQK